VGATTTECLDAMARMPWPTGNGKCWLLCMGSGRTSASTRAPFVSVDARSAVAHAQPLRKEGRMSKPMRFAAPALSGLLLCTVLLSAPVVGEDEPERQDSNARIATKPRRRENGKAPGPSSRRLTGRDSPSRAVEILGGVYPGKGEWAQADTSSRAAMTLQQTWAMLYHSPSTVHRAHRAASETAIVCTLCANLEYLCVLVSLCYCSGSLTRLGPM
jgi:heme A synthase